MVPISPTDTSAFLPHPSPLFSVIHVAHVFSSLHSPSIPLFSTSTVTSVGSPLRSSRLALCSTQTLPAPPFKGSLSPLSLPGPARKRSLRGPRGPVFIAPVFIPMAGMLAQRDRRRVLPAILPVMLPSIPPIPRGSIPAPSRSEVRAGLIRPRRRLPPRNVVAAV